MPETITLQIILRKEVDTIEQGRTLYEIVKQKLSDHPDITIAGTIANHFLTTEE